MEIVKAETKSTPGVFTMTIQITFWSSWDPLPYMGKWGNFLLMYDALGFVVALSIYVLVILYNRSMSLETFVFKFILCF